MVRLKTGMPQLVGKMSWLLGAEIVSKLTRIVTVVALAYWLAPEHFGDVALVTVLFEVCRTLAQSGLGTRFIAADESKLNLFTWMTDYLSRLFSLGAVLLMIGLGFFISGVAERELVVLSALTAPILLLYPLVTTRALFAQRQNDARSLAGANALTLCLENLFVAIGLTLEFSVLALPFGKLMAAMGWVLFWIRREKPAIKRGDFKDLLANAGFAGQIVSGDVLRLGRMHFDLLPALILLDPYNFGVYTFAKNAGVGLGQSLTQAFNTLLLPYLADRFRGGAIVNQLRRTTVSLMCVVGGILVLQALGAFIYVPLLFGEKWAMATTVVAVLCLSALPRLYLDVTNIWLRASHQSSIDLKFNLAVVVSYTITLLLLVQIYVPNSPMMLATLTTVSLIIVSVLPPILSFHLPEKKYEPTTPSIGRHADVQR